MVTLNKIYTGNGDKGHTALSDGSSRPKYDSRIQAYGTIDEANSTIGVARAYIEDKILDTILMHLQNDFFDLGADLSTPDCKEPKYPPLRIVPEQTKRLENEIDLLNADLEPLKSFVLPAGNKISAHLHVARTVTRRAEREMIAFSQTEWLNPEARIYINRASDLLFVAARWANNQGKNDILWQAGLTRNNN